MSSLFAASSADVPFPILSALVATPFLGALLMLVLPNNRPEYFKQVAFLVSGAAGMTARVMVEFDKHTADEFQFVDPPNGSPVSASRGHWVSTASRSGWWCSRPPCSRSPSLRSRPSTRRRRTMPGCSCWRQGSGVFLALDLFAFMFFEIVLVPMYFLIGQWGHGAWPMPRPVLRVHDVRVGVHARRHPRHGVPHCSRDRQRRVVRPRLPRRGTALATTTARWTSRWLLRA